MTTRERYQAVLNGEKADRLPVVEWAGMWWDETIAEWVQQGLPKGLDGQELKAYFGLDRGDGCWLSPIGDDCPKPVHHGAGIIKNENDYDKIIDKLYSCDKMKNALEHIKRIKPMHERGETCFGIAVDGFFWFPRTLLGIERHLEAFYDQPDLIHRINNDLLEYSLQFIEEALKIIRPEFMQIAEDMSYNCGPMISEDMFDEFMKPYYLELTPVMKQYNAKVVVDTDGFVEPMIPWYIGAGVDGVLPLERQSGVDINRIRQNYPRLVMLQGYDKMVLRNKGEDAMRGEFERILPVMKSGYFIPSVDHQTPPGVPLQDYRKYIELFFEYAYKAME